ncbi:Crp/Fnr family transcriptional regulator [Couchioplanes caeruleus]|uniref:CRP-like cAMP-binding protein n=2 Tax=Couchioplanes caeruleus TaxID=56438 RepID=A0A1K0FBE3_9ACTN|nr:Crp/Fnr family transcriptional regulator [Couchioplanes caeruleus]OJF10072.1 hypothetical protein BG844_34070 [Couchioplanes caeruleus subsp. caeruleus]
MVNGHPRPPFWRALTDGHRQELLQIGNVRHHPTDTVIVREGDETDFAIVLLDGCVKVSTHGNRGYQAILGLRSRGDLVGELAGVDGGRRSATLTALTVVEALTLPAGAFRRFLRAYPDAAEILQRTVSVRLREADRYRSAAGSETVPQRLAHLLLHLGASYGKRLGSRVLIGLPLSQEDLAGLILTSQRTVGRVLERWRDERLVETGRRSIVLLSVDELRRRSAP